MKQLLTLTLILGSVGVLSAEDKKGGGTVSPVLTGKMKGIDGKDVDLSKLQGKVVLFVNVASKCGLTPQYKGLQALHDKYASQGLVIIGVPANEFGEQEPGSDSEISEFCQSKYGVKFTMLSKVVVKGDGICPLYEKLTIKDKGAKFPGPITWNFEKFLVGKNGEVVARFSPRTAPDDAKLVAELEAALEKK